MKTCQVCGKPIDFESRAKKYCSPECRARVKYERDRAWLAARPGKAAEYGRKWYADNTEARRKASRESYRKKCLRDIQKERKNETD